MTAILTAAKDKPLDTDVRIRNIYRFDVLSVNMIIRDGRVVLWATKSTADDGLPDDPVFNVVRLTVGNSANFLQAGRVVGGKRPDRSLGFSPLASFDPLALKYWAVRSSWSKVCGCLSPVIAWAGVFISLILAVSHAQDTSAFCGPAAGCNAVTGSVYGKIGGIPLADVGLVAWIGILTGLFATLTLPSSVFRRRLSLLVKGMVYFGVLISLGLIGVQAFKLHAFCPLCLGSAACFFALAALSFATADDAPPLLPPTAIPAVLVGTFATFGAFTALLWLQTPPQTVKVLATVDGQNITEEDLPMAVRLAIQPLEEEAAKVRHDWLDQHLDEVTLEKEAKRLGIPSKDLLTEQSTHVPVATDAEMMQWRKDHRDEIDRPNETIAARIKLARESKAEDEYIANLRKSHGTTILVHPPVPPLVRFDLSNAYVEGSIEAPTVFVVFSDFECPFCRQLEVNLREVRQKLGDQVAVAFKNLPLEEIHPKAKPFAMAALAAGAQGKFWEYHDSLLARDMEADDSTLIELAHTLGLDVPRFTADLHSTKVADRLAADVQEAAALGLQETPTLFLNGRMAGGLKSTDELIQLAR